MGASRSEEGGGLNTKGEQPEDSLKQQQTYYGFGKDAEMVPREKREGPRKRLQKGRRLKKEQMRSRAGNKKRPEF